MQDKTNYKKFQELTIDESNEINGGFDWMDILDFVIRCTVVAI